MKTIDNNMKLCLYSSSLIDHKGLNTSKTINLDTMPANKDKAKMFGMKAPVQTLKSIAQFSRQLQNLPKSFPTVKNLTIHAKALISRLKPSQGRLYIILRSGFRLFTPSSWITPRGGFCVSC